MKPKHSIRHLLLLTGTIALTLSTAQAQDGTWTQSATTQGDPAEPLTWSETTNWEDEIVAGGTDATAFFTVNSSGAQTVTLDTDVTLGNLTLNRNHNLTLVLDPEDPKSLTLDVATGTPLLSLSAGRILNINSSVAGSDGLEVTGGAATGGVALRGANTFTGGIFLNNGSLGENNARTTTAGLNDNHITISGTSFACFDGGTQITGGVEIPAGSQFRSGTNNSNFNITGVLSGSGTLTHQQYGLGNQSILLTNTANTFTGNLDYDMPRTATFVVNSLGDDGRVRFGLTNFLNNQDRQHVFEFGSGATESLVFNQREFEILGSAPTTVPRPNAAFEIRSNNANHALVINTDMINSHTGTVANLRFSGSGSQANTFAGNIGDGPGDGTDPSVLNIFKLNGGNWNLSGANTYTGNTTVSGGTLTLTDTSETRILIGDHAVNNAILGTGTVNLDGMFVFDLTGASTTVGDFWNIVSVGSLNETYGSTFGVSSTQGAFIETSTGIWTISENGQEYEFSQDTGVLTVIGEPSDTPFELWAGPGVAFDGDASGDGVSNGLAFLLGAASPNDSALDLVPEVSEDAGALVLTFSMLDSAARGTASLSIEHSTTLAAASWTTVTVPDISSTVDDVVFTITGTSPFEVTATIPASKAANGKLFARLNGVSGE